MAEALFHVLSQRWVQRPAGSREDMIYAGGRGACHAGRLPGIALNVRRCPVDRRMRGSRHHLIGNAIRLLFQRIVVGADAEFGLQAFFATAIAHTAARALAL
jgi:hypothetical protein